MNRIYGLTAAALLASLTITPLAFGQSSAAAQAARLQRMQAQQAAVLARIKAAQAAATAAPTVAPTTPPTAIVVPKPATTVVPKPATTTASTVAPTGSVAPKPATSGSAAPATSGSAAPAAPAVHSLALDLDELKKTRTDRRHAEVVDLQSRWGTLLSDPRSATELKLHAQRSAYLQRIRALGEKANDATFVKSVDALITKEDDRDANAMNALRSGALPAGTAVAAPAAAPAAGASK